jgi:hypothetical protein
MLAVLNNYLNNLNSQIDSYEKLIAQKREEAQKLTQLQGRVVEALGSLKSVVDELQRLDPQAIATVKAAALQIFDQGGMPEQPSQSPTPETQVEEEQESQPEVEQMEAAAEDFGKTAESSPQLLRLSANVVYNPEKATVYAGINAQQRARAWGEWLCLIHSVGDRFNILHKSRFAGYSYELVVAAVGLEDAQRLAQMDLTKNPSALENADWQPQKRRLQALFPRPRCCQPGDLGIGDIARKEDGREYRIVGVSDDGAVVKVINQDGMEMAFSVGTLYLVKKASAEVKGNGRTATEIPLFSNGTTQTKVEEKVITVGTPVIIHSSRYQGKYEGKQGVIAAEPSNYGVKVDVGEDKPIFFLNEDISLIQ